MTTTHGKRYRNGTAAYDVEREHMPVDAIKILKEQPDIEVVATILSDAGLCPRQDAHDRITYCVGLPNQFCLVAENAGDVLERTLAAAGALCTRFDVYRTVPAPPTEPTVSEKFARFSVPELIVTAVESGSTFAAVSCSDPPLIVVVPV